MKKCKYCQSEIDKKAKVCPQCRREQKSFHIGKVLIAVILVLVLTILFVRNQALDDYELSSPVSSYKKDNFSYEVSNSYADEYGISYYIEGKVKNNSNKDYSYVEIEFVCYDAEGNNLGTVVDNTNNLMAYETWKFKGMALFNDINDIDHCNYKQITGF